MKCCDLSCVKAWLYHGSIILGSNALVLGLAHWMSYGNLRLGIAVGVVLAVLDAFYIKGVW